tara:strand:- start:94 stop:345 length:252 start_codon:yes stop_codon:yes gene_type:complete
MEATGSQYLEGEYYLDDEAIRFTDLDECIIGTDHRGYLVYCYNKMLRHFMKDMGTLEDAQEWIDFNVLGIKPDSYTIIYSNEH